MTNQAQTATASASPFHLGERDVQTRAGVREEAETRGKRMLSADLNANQRQFFQSLPFIVSGHTDATGQPWAGLITGEPGFLNMEEASNQFSLRWSQANNLTGVEARPGNALGLLGIQLATRRRNRLNATVFANDDDQWRMLIDQGYGNCPKYITEREWPAELFTGPYHYTEQAGLSDYAATLASTTDTFFIATSSGPQFTDADTQSSAWGADISHRGGEAGFLRREHGQLLFDDFPGNNMFNTLGNIAQYPFCGILIIDFSSGNMIQLAAKAVIEHFDGGRRVALDVLSTRAWCVD